MLTGQEIGKASAFPETAESLVGSGMTYRQWLIGMALQGLCANGIAGSHHRPTEHARDAVANADAVLEQLAKEPQ